jgi:hypothetical protein
MIRQDDISHTEPVEVKAQTLQVQIPGGAEQASVYMDRSGLIHLADIKMRPPWWRSAWLPALAFLAGAAVATLAWTLGS